MEEYLGWEREEKMSPEEEVVVLIEEETTNLRHTHTKDLAMKKKSINRYLKNNKNQKNL